MHPNILQRVWPYRKCSDIVKHDLLKLYNKYLTQGEYLSAVFSVGIIAFIPKKGDSHDLNTWRPISMLNTDYKLFIKILWTRLQPLLSRTMSFCLYCWAILHIKCTYLRNIMLKAKLTSISNECHWVWTLNRHRQMVNCHVVKLSYSSKLLSNPLLIHTPNPCIKKK